MARVLAAALAALALAVPPAAGAGRVGPVTAAGLGASWHPGCPVGPAELRLVRVRFFGFEGRRHEGALVVHRDVAAAVLGLFDRLERARFPLRRVVPIAAYGGSDERSLAADNTSGFNCRRAVAVGPPRWSEHAYGRAIDVDPVENPYLEGGRVHPRAGAAYLDRSRARPGMAVAGGVLVREFERIGWGWGGRWRGTPDYQHFSASGR